MKSEHPKMADQETCIIRREAVEAVILKGEWSLSMQGRVARKFGCSVKTVRRDAAMIRRQWAEDVGSQNTDEKRAIFLARLRQAQNDARSDGAHTARSRLLALESRVAGIDQPMQVEVTHKAEHLSPVQQAQLIVEHYDAAKALIDAAAPGAIAAIEADFKEVANAE